MLEADSLRDVPFFLCALDVVKHFIEPAQELLGNHLSSLFVLIQLLGFLDPRSLQCLELLSFCVALTLHLTANIV